MAWIPFICAAVLVHGDKFLGKYGPEPDNFDRNLACLKIAMWAVAFVELVVDKNMVIKKGPALYVAIIFCLVDMLRFHMEATRLIYDDDEREEEIDRLANMVINALENNDNESAFKHAVREVIQRGRKAEKMDNSQCEDTFMDSPVERDNISSPFELKHSEHEDTTEYGTLGMK